MHPRKVPVAANKLQKTLEKIEQLKNQAKQLEAKEKLKQRKEDNRKKILAGAFLLHWIEHDPAAKKHFDEHLPGFLSRDIDREMFGFKAHKAAADEPVDAVA